MDKNFLIGGLAVAILALLGFLYMDGQNGEGEQSVAQNGADAAPPPAPQAGQSVGASQGAPVPSGPSQQLSEVTVPDQPFSQSQPNAAASAQPSSPPAAPNPEPPEPKDKIVDIPIGSFSDCTIEWGDEKSNSACSVQVLPDGTRQVVFSKIAVQSVGEGANVIAIAPSNWIRFTSEKKGLSGAPRLAKFVMYNDQTNCILADGVRAMLLCLKK